MYSEAPEVLEVAERVIDEYGDYLESVYGQPVRIKYLFKDSKKSQYIGKCSKATGKWAHLVMTDYVIEIWLPFWKNATENEKKALLYHELKHVQMVEKENENGEIEISWKIKRHDSELFVDEFSLFGAWRKDYQDIVDVCKELQ